jgi:hypothetical protein
VYVYVVIRFDDDDDEKDDNGDDHDDDDDDIGEDGDTTHQQITLLYIPHEYIAAMIYQ